MLIISYKLLLLSLLVLSLLLLSMSIYIIIALLPHRLVVVLLFLLFTYLFFISITVIIRITVIIIINHCHMFTKKFLQLHYNFIFHFYDIFHLNQLLILIYFRASFMEIFLIILIWF